MYCNFRKMLKEFRQSQKFTQAQFAERLHITKTHLSGLERGISNPSIELLIRFSKLSGASLDEIFCLNPTNFGTTLQKELLKRLATYDTEFANKVTEICIQNIDALEILRKEKYL
jgi:Predicted transcriptional regulators